MIERGERARHEGLIDRALALVDGATTDLADAVLPVPLDHYRDPELFARERELLRRTPLALTTTAQMRQPDDYVVRDALDPKARARR